MNSEVDADIYLVPIMKKALPLLVHRLLPLCSYHTR